MATKITLTADNQADRTFDEIVADLERADKAAGEAADSLSRVNAQMDPRFTKAYSEGVEEATRDLQRMAEQQRRSAFMHQRIINEQSLLTKAVNPEVWSKVALGIGVAVGAYKAVEWAITSVGKKIDTTNKEMTESARRLAEAINEGSITIEEAQERTGKSAEELGFKFTNAWARSSKNFAENVSIIEDAWMRLRGLDPNEVRSQELLEKKEAELRAVGVLLEEQDRLFKRLAETEKDYAAVAAATTQQQLDDLMRLATARAQAHGATKEQIDEALRLREAINARQYELEREQLQRTKQLAAEGAAYWRQYYAELRQMDEAEHNARIHAAEQGMRDWLRVQGEIGRGRMSLRDQEREHFFDSLEREAQKQKDHEELLLDIRKQRVEKQAQLAMQAAETDADRARIAFEAEKQIRELDYQHKVATEEKKLKAAQAAKQKEVDAEKAKVDALKKLTGKQGENLFESTIQQFSPQQVAAEVTRQRQAAAAKGQDLNSRERAVLDRRIRMETMRDFQRGNVGAGEIARGQANLAARVFQGAQAQGQLSAAMVQTMKEQGREFLKAAAELDALKAEVNTVKQALADSSRRKGRTR